MKKLLISFFSVIITIFTISAINANTLAYNQTGWQEKDGKWYYYSQYGEMYNSGKYEINGRYYIFDENGILKDTTGWYREIDEWYVGDKKITNVIWYFITEDGSLATRWRQVGKNWYYFDNEGKMLHGETIKTEDNRVYIFDENGAMISKTGWYKVIKNKDNKSKVVWYYLKGDGTVTTGWKQEGRTWYYFDESGEMADKPTKIYSDYYHYKIYCFNSSGAWINFTGWYKTTEIAGKETIISWYYLDEGIARTGWWLKGNIRYYFDENGKMADKPTIVYEDIYYGRDAKIAFFDKSGAHYAYNGWYADTKKYNDGTSEINWYYLENGYGVTGLKNIGGINYYFRYDGVMCADDIVYVDGTTYCFNKSGAQVKQGWFRHLAKYQYNEIEDYIEEQWYYIAKGGEFYKGFHTINGITYYFDPDCRKDGIK